ncbi:hypothetical protein PHISCL_09071 [Aspergillus sclerotialis]|uniref:Uncharacterized protein n=1 Tax=Aspergillus sclerotialis TaxID=2070753 RepID=A0A3A2Z7J1_9EURO|nr:hypothetical protein PHISCL_09071 [Aspergillus sclerotialis]
MSMSTTAGRGTLLFLGFILLSYLSICLSAPANSLIPYRPVSPFHDDLDGSKVGSLVRRGSKWDKYQELLNEYNRSPKVGQDEEKFMKFDSGPATLASSGFDICFGVVVLAPGGVILGHYNPEKKNIARGLENIPSLYEKHKDSLTNARTILYASVDPNSEAYADSDLAAKLEAMLREDLKMEPTIVKYTESSNVMELADDDDIDIDKYNELAATFMDGTIVVKHKENGESMVEFVHLDMQKDPHGTNDGN